MQAKTDSSPETLNGTRARSNGATPHESAQLDCEVLIIGAGFGGMGAAIQLQRCGVQSFIIVDRADDLGGTWHANTYPGLTVDIPSVTYSYSFEPNPHWSHVFARGAELKTYANTIASKYGLRSHMRFGCDVQSAEYDETHKRWTVHLQGQAPLRARIVIAAIGYLSRPKRPKIPGLESFAGKVIHTAAWDHDYALQGRKAAVIGTGATSVQLLPEIAPQLAELHVYQRTPIWVAPKRDGRISKNVQRVFSQLPFTQASLRLLDAGVLELMTQFGMLYYRRFPIFAKLAAAACKLHLARTIKDPELRRKLTPQYGFGCKRPTVSNKYYRVFNRSHVELITDGIARIEPDGIVTEDGRKRAVDTLILATGFNVWEREGLLTIRGKHGQELNEVWRASGYQSYEGITMPGFPNLFYLPAPYSYTGLSYFFTLEGEMKHIARCLTAMQRQGARSFEVRQAATDAFVARMKGWLKDSSFLNGDCTAANSYYFDPHGEPSLLRPTTVARAHLRHANFPLSDYQFE